MGRIGCGPVVGDLSFLVRQPTNTVEVSSELSGTVRSVLMDYNSQVKIGQELAQLDTDKLKTRIISA